MKTYFLKLTRNINVYITLLLLSFGGLSNSVFAQEFLTGAKTNPLINKEIKRSPEIFLSGKAEAQPLILPFFEDFSKGVGFPNEKHFIDKQAFVNQTFPVFPPTIGVVTLDALNEYGQIYPHLTSVSQGADTLTSQFIRLDSLFSDGEARQTRLEDSLYFSFYFQPGGGGVLGSNAGELIGSQPNTHDSLVLEFGYTLFLEDTTVTIWDHIWSTPGFSINEWLAEDTCMYFKQVIIPIMEEKYWRDSFQFRFRNYASLEPQQGIAGWEGNVDQWHIDYIRLDAKRSQVDSFTNDIAFVSPTTSFLKNYQAMPWNQFRNTDMKSNFTNQLTNLSKNPLPAKYQYTITQNGNIKDEYESGSVPIEPYDTTGIHSVASQASPPILFAPNLTDTTVFIITHVFENEAGIDFFPGNDTCVFEQKFYDYYAYDDGSAEFGYCLNNQFNIAYLAMKFSLAERDSLRAVRMWFNHTKKDENLGATFSIFLWKDNNGEPDKQGTKILSELKPIVREEFDDFEEFLDFAEYELDIPLRLDSGIFWIGFEQQGNVQLNIGFDQNNDSREFFRYNTRGIWEKSVFKGTPMLRPVFGKSNKPVPNPAPPQTTIVGPNPMNEELRITNHQSRITKVEVFNIIGMKISEKNCRDNNIVLNVANYKTGIYFVRVTKENNRTEIFKLIKN